MSVLSLVPHAVAQAPSPFIFATVSTTQPVPTDLNDPLYVVEPWNPNHYLTVDAFPQLHGATLPAAGAQVVLLRVEGQPLRCLWWEGANS